MKGFLLAGLFAFGLVGIAAPREDGESFDGSDRRGQGLTTREHLLLGTDPDREGAFLEVDLPDVPHLRVRVSRSSALEYLAWIDELDAFPVEARTFASDAAGDGVPNIVKFGLDLQSHPMEARELMPRQVRVRFDGHVFEAVEFVARDRPEKNRVVYSLESDEGAGDWRAVESPELVDRESLGDGLERRVLRSDRPSSRNGAPSPRLRLVARYEPAPTFFAHYISELNPGWGAMPYLATPMPAYFRLFYDQPDRMQPVPKGPGDRFLSTGGLHRDLPLLPPGFSFASAVESAELEIRRARRAGVDGFAVNCLGGSTDFLPPLFAAASRLADDNQDHAPFAIALSIDVNVIPHEERESLAAVARLIRAWLVIGDSPEHASHLARRGGRPMVMGYQSHWIWIHYLDRLFELWEREEAGWKDPRLVWPEKLGRPPGVPILPAVVIEEYRTKRKESLDALAGADDRLEDGEYRDEVKFFRSEGLRGGAAAERARESVARRRARHEAVRRWARDPDGWRYIRKAYDHLEELVGEKIFWQFDAVDIDPIAGDAEGALRVIGRDFPAVNMFLPKGNLADLARRVIRDSGAEWGEPLNAQYVAYGQNEQDGQFAGNFHGADGTAAFRRSWYRALGKNLESGEPVRNEGLAAAPDSRSSLIQYTSWNDYVEHSHLAPGLQMRYALPELTRYFVHQWKTGEPPEGQDDQVYLFYRKYADRPEPRSFPFEHASPARPARIEVIAILGKAEGNARLELLRGDPGDAERFLNRAESRPVGRGFQVETYTGPEDGALWAPGTVRARLVKGSGETISATGWEEITRRPFRQDYTLAGASSRCDDLWKKDMPDKRMRSFSFSEYGDADDDGLPNWFEMFYFGRGWLNREEQTRAEPDADENRDGTNNLAHYLDGTNPTWFAEPLPYRENARGEPEPFRIGWRGRVRIQAEDFDRGGLGVAYQKSELRTMEGGEYRESRSDLASHRQVDAHEEDGGDWMVAPLGDGDWMTYTVELLPGSYRVCARVREGGGGIVLELDGKEVLEVEVRNEGLWSTQELGVVEVARKDAGVQILRLRFQTPDYGLNWFQFERLRN